MTKLPTPDEFSPELRAETQKLEEITARKNATEAEAHELARLIKSDPTQSDKDAEVQRVLANEPARNLSDEYERKRRDFRALEDAEHQQKQRVEQCRKEAGKKLCAFMKPRHDELMKKIGKSLFDAYVDWRELYPTKQHIMRYQLGYNGLFDADPQEVIDIPTDRGSPLADFLRECLRLGYIKKLPEGLE
jgi:hypothetical protein